MNMDHGFMISLPDLEQAVETSPKRWNNSDDHPSFNKKPQKPTKMGLLQKFAVANVAFMLPSAATEEPRSSCGRSPFIKFESLNGSGAATTARRGVPTSFYGTDMHYMPLKPFENEADGRAFKDTLEHAQRADVYFIPQQSNYEEHKKTYHVFSDNMKYCLAISGGLYYTEKNPIPVMRQDATEGKTSRQNDAMIMNESNRTHYHYCALFVNDNFDSSVPSKNTRSNAKWTAMMMNDFADHPDALPPKSRALLSQASTKEDLMRFRQGVNKVGAIHLVRKLLESKLETIRECLRTLTINSVQGGFDVKHESSKDSSNVPILDAGDVNRIVGHKSTSAIIQKLKGLGANVILPYKERSLLTRSDQLTWNDLRGCEDIRKEIEHILINATDEEHAEMIKMISKATSGKAEHNYSKRILFCGPPGTGKTLTAKIMADSAGIPMINVTASDIMNKYIGNSERSVKDIFSLIRKLGQIRGQTKMGPSSIFFLDEADSLCGSNKRREHSSGVLTTFLEELDGFQDGGEFMFVGCTNDKKGLDGAFTNRMQTVIQYKAFDEKARADIYQRHAPHLTSEELLQLSRAGDGLTGRDIDAVSKSAMSQRLSELTEQYTNTQILKELSPEQLRPTVDTYLKCINQRVENVYQDNYGDTKAFSYSGMPGLPDLKKKLQDLKLPEVTKEDKEETQKQPEVA